MRIELSNGYVLLKETVTRKIAREYTAALYKGASIGLAGQEGKGLNPINVDLASESLVIGLVEKVVVMNGEKETYVDPSIEWLDNLPKSDFEKLETAVLQIYHGVEERAKK